MERLLILGSLFELSGLVKKARARGLYTVACDGYPDGPARAYADQAWTVDVRETERIAELCRKEKIDGIITSFSDLMFECMVKIAAQAGLPCYADPDMLPAYRDKEVTKGICRKLGIAVPAYIRLSEDMLAGTEPAVKAENPAGPDAAAKADALETALRSAGIHFPALLKPVDSYGSRGMHVVHTVAELQQYFADSAQYSGDGCALLETLSLGRELNCQAFLADGKLHLVSVADRETAPWRTDAIPINYANRYPSDVFDEVCGPVTDILQRYAAHTGQMWGPMAMQCFWDGREIQVCEIAARYFGFEHELTEMSAGMDIEELLLDLVCDRNAAVRRFEGYSAKGSRWAEGIYLTTIREGVVTDQSAMEKIAGWPGVRETHLFCKNGDTVGIRGPQPYFARYYIEAGTREDLGGLERAVLQGIHAAGEDGEELLFLPLQEPG